MKCPDTLAAMCSVKSGAVFGECVQPPKSSSSADKKEFVDRIMGEGKEDRPITPLNPGEIEQAFSRGQFKSPVDGSTVRFKLPRGMQ
jgi:hypothetical protein